MLKGNRFLLRLNGDPKSQLRTQVQRLMMFTFGRHWCDNILYLCEVLHSRRLRSQPHSSEEQPMSGTWAMKNEMGTSPHGIGLLFSRPFSTDLVLISVHKRHRANS